jgi:uridine kinase
MPPIIIAVTGPSGSGKTTIANMISQRLGRGACVMLSLDNYYFDLSHLSEEELALHNFDHPRGLDLKLFEEHLKLLKAGETVEIPEYSFKTRARTKNTFKIDPTGKVIVAEGIHVASVEDLRVLYDKIVYVKTDLDLCILRRIERDMRDRGREALQIISQYRRDVRPMFIEFVGPIETIAHIVIENNGDISRIPEKLRFDIEPLIEYIYSAAKPEKQIAFRSFYEPIAKVKNDTKPIFIFIGGGAGSGKTTLSHKLSEKVIASGKTCRIIKMDDFFHEIPDDREIEEFRLNENFDREEMYKYPELRDFCIGLYEGRTVVKPIFNFLTNKSLTNEEVSSSDVVVIEGLFALSFAKKMLPAYFEMLTVFVSQNSYREMIKTRIIRDGKERELSPTEVLRKEKVHVGHAFFSVIANSRSKVDINILNERQEALIQPQPTIADVAVDDQIDSEIVPHLPPHPLDFGVDEIVLALEEREILLPGIRLVSV